jgi:ATP-binding cassette subfamily F protein 3
MIALSLKDIAKSFGADTVLDGVTLTLTDDMRMGLVGPNGAGKTTLLRIICGEISADSGTVSMGNGAGYLKQEVSEGTQDTVWDTMLGVFSHAFALEERMRELEHAMEDAAGDETAWQRVSREYERVTRSFEEADGYGYKSAINGVLKGLGLNEDVYDRAVCTLSGGQRARLMLAKLLLEKPKLLLLDEPTNHLDTDAVYWLEGYLKAWQGAVMIVSHDRWFLDQTCTHIADLHSGIVDVYIGSYTSFVAQRDEKRRLQQKAYEHNQREITRQKKVIEQYKAWGNSGGGKNFIKMHARETLLNKMEKVDRPEGDSGRISLRLGTAARGSSDVLQMADVAMAWQDSPPLFSGIGLHLFKGERAALIGPNGVGKTTLLRIAAHRLAPTQGEIVTGTGVSVGYYDQLQENLDTRHTVIEEMRGDYPDLSDGDLRNILASFLFLGDDVFKPVSA